jgi:glycine hydroxymethyltransferase
MTLRRVARVSGPGMSRCHGGGIPAKARYVLDPAVADRVAKQAADLLADFPLYPTIDLA